MWKGKQFVAKCYEWNHLKIEAQYEKTRLIVQTNLQRHQHSAHSLTDKSFKMNTKRPHYVEIMLKTVWLVIHSNWIHTDMVRRKMKEKSHQDLPCFQQEEKLHLVRFCNPHSTNILQRSAKQINALASELFRILWLSTMR